MSAGSAAGAAGAAAAAAAIANAIKASGAIVSLEPGEFLDLLTRIEAPLVVASDGKSLFSRGHQYLTAYRGFIFHAKSRTPLDIPEWCEVVRAKAIWTPT